MENEPIIVCDNLVKIYKTGDIEVLALQGLDLSIARGELMAIIGNSGSGKSTLLNMLGGLDRPSAGKLHVDGLDLFSLSKRELVTYKRETVGFVWQNSARNLMPYLTALQNVMMPMQFSGKIRGDKAQKERAAMLLDLVGLSSKAESYPAALSGGEQQRVGIAVALANAPKILLADEPTGAVDSKTSADILDVFGRANREENVTVVIVTHDRMIAKKVDRVASIRDGKISSERVSRVSYAERMNSVTSFADAENEQQEFAILDRAGRVQIPREVLESLSITGNRVRMETTDGKIVISKPEE